jgi:hypothetical protein
MAMKPRAMKNGKTKKMMRGGMAESLKNRMAMKRYKNREDLPVAKLAQKETAR